MEPAKRFISGVQPETVDCRVCAVDTGVAISKIYEIISVYISFYDIVDDIIEFFVAEQIDFPATCD